MAPIVEFDLRQRSHVGREAPARRGVLLPRHVQRGAAAVEFALGALVFFTVLFAIIEGGRATMLSAETSWLAQEGARFASVRGNSRPDADGGASSPGVLTGYVRAYLRTLSPSLDDSEIVVALTPSDTAVGSSVQVTVNRTMNSVVPFIDGIAFSHTAALVISY